jgi:hypothetical protein
LRRDSTFIEYVYTSKKENKISRPDYGDVIVNKMKWKCKQDTLYLQYSLDYTVSYPIIKLTSKELVVKDIKRAWGRDTLFFTIAKDQKMELQ